MKINDISYFSKNLNFSVNDKKSEGEISQQAGTVQLSDKEKLEIERLKNEDKRVRTHENAHKAAAGNLAKGAPTYKYKIGPDGKRYAVGGHVQIDISEVPNDPEATIRKAQQIRTAALAPAEPSAQDQKVAVQASRMEAKARQELYLAERNNINQPENQIFTKNNYNYGQTEKFSSFEVNA